MADEEFIEKKVPGRVYFSREVEVQAPDRRRVGRYISRVLPKVDRSHFATVEKEVTIRVTASGREQIKAFFMIDDRSIRTLHLQRFSSQTGLPREAAHFCLRGEEIQQLLDLALMVRTAEFSGTDKVRLRQEELHQFALSKDAARSLLKADFKMIKEIVEQEITDRDLVAIAYRRKQLAMFERLLTDQSFFDAERQRLQLRGEEAVWQRFFETNSWIFGYGLFYVFTSGFDDAKLEQIVAGASIAAAGKRADALLRTRGFVSSLCFVEIKTHRTQLLEDAAYRSDTWGPCKELSGAVAQAQKTVERAERVLGSQLAGRKEDGTPTGQSAFLLRPRSVVVVGSLQQFLSPHGVNEPRFTSFELYRRQLVSPEVITFDELYQRAKYIVDSSAETAARGGT